MLIIQYSKDGGFEEGVSLGLQLERPRARYGGKPDVTGGGDRCICTDMTPKT